MEIIGKLPEDVFNKVMSYNSHPCADMIRQLTDEYTEYKRTYNELYNERMITTKHDYSFHYYLFHATLTTGEYFDSVEEVQSHFNTLWDETVNE
jgi:ethanolamine utilization protein EutP (predicted NTPase)